MSFHFLSHPWEVRDVEDGLMVSCTHRDLDAMSVPMLVDELYDLVLENGQRNLYLDFARIHQIASIVIGKLIALDTRLHQVGGKLIVCNLDSSLYEACQAARAHEVLDLRVAEYQPV